MENILETSFNSRFLYGSCVGGSVEKKPIIFLKNGRKINMIVGEEHFSMWAYSQNTFKEGETVAQCLKRHGFEVGDVKKVVVKVVDTTGDEPDVWLQMWTPDKGWTRWRKYEGWK